MSNPVTEEITASALRERLEQGTCVLVDVREADEFARERIGAAHHLPLSRLGPSALPPTDGSQLVLCCASGARSREAARRLAMEGTLHLEGGLAAWKAAGLETVFDPRVPISIMRQVQIVAGSLVLLGVVLGALATPWLYGLSAFVGAGLVFAGASGICAMARLLEMMPWNRAHTPAPRQDLGLRAS